jgi:peptidoglycan biosynthesis protein MviN/MurJ (putative lipid II flippase)
MQVLVALAVMTLCLMYVNRPLDWWITASVADRLAWLSVSVFAGAAVYFAVLLALGLRPSTLRLRPA